MNKVPIQEYTVSLCRMVSTEFVPYEQITIAADDDKEAIERATDWAMSVLEITEEEAWLMVKQGACDVHFEKLETL
jgi:hypothetical protein